MRKLDIPHFRARVTIPHLLTEQVALRPSEPFAHFPYRTLSFAEIHAEAMAWAKAFVAIGVEPGDHVATLMPSCASWVPVYFGAMMAGAVLVPLNARYKRHELAYVLPNCDARVLVTTDSFFEHVDYRALLTDVLPGVAHRDPRKIAHPAASKLNAIVVCDGDTGDGFLGEDDFLTMSRDIAQETLEAAMGGRTLEDTAAIIYTSGTTSNPKGCELTHRGIQTCWSTFPAVVDLQAGECVWMPMPFFHTGGIGPMTALLARGAAFVAHPHFDADDIVDLLDRVGVDHFYSGFPQLTLPVLEHPRFGTGGLDHVKSVLNVGPPAIQERVQSLLGPDAVVLNLFGMTEGAGIVTFTRMDDPPDVRLTTSGLPPPHTDVRIADPETNLLCDDGTIGEIQFRGGGALAGYYQNPESTAETILQGGWVRTGDRGFVDPAGYLRYLGRIKDMLKVGGENVGATEIEAFLQGLPGVRLAQVIGIPDDHLGEVPAAFVEMIEGHSLTEAQITAACTGQLAKWKIPRKVIFVTEWPMSATKVMKFQLRNLLPDEAKVATDG